MGHFDLPVLAPFVVHVETIYPDMKKMQRSNGTPVEAAVSMACSKMKNLDFNENGETCPGKATC